MMATQLLKCGASCYFMVLAVIGLSLTSCDESIYRGNLLSPLIKALSEENPREDFTPQTKPDSGNVRYMKRLHKSSKQEGTHLYNTARLIIPRNEGLEQSREYVMQDISYSLNQVRSQEQLLKSVLLYSFDHSHSAPFTSLCYLKIKEQMPPKDQMGSPHLGMQQSVPLLSFHVHTERKVHRHWVEVDLTSFHLPLIRAHEKDIHLLINLTCVEDMIPRPGGQVHKSPVELRHRSPSLLLYLNDTSEAAYHRRATQGRMVNLTSNCWNGNSIRRDSSSRKGRGTLESTSLLPMYNFPSDYCDLYDFKVSFRQLKLDKWIIAPRIYNPRYCKGTCPRAVGFIYGSPLHTMFQNLIYDRLGSPVPRPSCVPSEYNPMSVLTIEKDGSIAYKEYEEMIATRCTCQ